jgi:hypothetical protein
VPPPRLLLEVETRNMKGPRAFDASGLPLHADNQTVVKERYTFDKNEPDVIHNEVTVFDHALTHPWTVTKHYRRSPDRHPWWVEDNCMENNRHQDPGRALLSQRRRHDHAGKEGSAASRSAIFQSAAEVATIVMISR